jgi:putative nucleotidyltransferase with HDIG domain
MTKGYVEIMNGLFQGQKSGFTRWVTVGRGKANSLRLMDPKVSRIHAKIETTKEGFRIKDVNSKNGVFVNDARISSQLLKSGDTVRIGLTDLRFSEREIVKVEEESPRAKIATKKKSLDPSEREFDQWAVSSDIGIQELRSRFRSFLRVNRTIGSEFDMKKAFEKVLEEIFVLLPADRGAILSVNEEIRRLEILCSRTRKGPVGVSDILISQTILNRVMEESVGILIEDTMSDDRFELSESISIEDIRSALCVPLIQNHETIGIIYLDVSGQKKAFTDDDLDMLMAIAGPASVQVQNALYVNQLKNTYWDTIQALANAIEARDSYTIGHNRRVSSFAMIVSTYLGWTEEDMRTVEQGGILHDIGKIGVADAILLKKGRLEDEEQQNMRRHPEIGAQMIKGIDFLRPVIPYVLSHHERWDGSGYPLGLRGPEIPAEGRLLAVCDAFDAMTSTRPYRTKMSPDHAIEEVYKNKGKQFDPKVVDAFFRAWHAGKIAKFMKADDEALKNIHQAINSNSSPPKIDQISLMDWATNSTGA